MSVYYKFNSELNYSHVEFDGLHIAVSDLKKAILHQKRLGKSADFDLLISNAQTKEEYKDDQNLIPKNTSLIVARIPLSNQNKKQWEVAPSPAERAAHNPSTDNINHDISRMNGSEEDKIQAMMMQSTLDYDPVNYQRGRGSTMTGEVPSTYRCHKCLKPGHWIKNCPMNAAPGKDHHHHNKTRQESKKMTGIPRSLRETLNAENQEPVQSKFLPEALEIPADLICAVCKGIFKDAVMIPCCGSSFCDECITAALIESEDNECPDCHEKGNTPGSLIPNRFLRNNVTQCLLARGLLEKEPESNPATSKTEEQPIPEKVLQSEEPQQHVEDSQGFESNDVANDDDLDEPYHVEAAEKDSESDDDDNITVTVPTAHQQSRGASFRDSRSRRGPTHSVGEYHDTYSHSSASKSHQDEGESHEDDSDTYPQRHHTNSKRSNHSYESSAPQGISTLGAEDKGNNRDSYHQSGSHSAAHGDSYHQHSQHQQQPMYTQGQGQHPGMMPQMHSYPQGPYQQPAGSFYSSNQMRPMRFEHQGGYQVPLRHHGPSHMMRPSMHDGYGMRHQRPPMNYGVKQNIHRYGGSGIIDDPLEAFEKIMREKEKRKDRYRPMHINDRRSRSFERKRSPIPYSPDNRRQKNYPGNRKRSRSFKSNSSKSFSRSRSRSRNRTQRARSKSRSHSPRYRRKDNVQNKDRRDDRHRSPNRRGINLTSNKNSRAYYKRDSSSKQGLRDIQEVHQYQENSGNLTDKVEENYDYMKDSNDYAAPHSLDEQPPPPGDESEPQLQEPKPSISDENKDKSTDKTAVNSNGNNGVNDVGNESKKEHLPQSKGDHHHHHRHKKSRDKSYETSVDEKKVRDKKKRKKSREHEKKRSKKEKKVRSGKDKEKKSSSKTGSVEKTPELPTPAEDTGNDERPSNVEPTTQSKNLEEACNVTPEETKTEQPVETEETSKAISEKQFFRRSDSVLDINPNVDLDDDWTAPEVSKWEQDENKSTTSLENFELDSSAIDVKKTSEEKVTSEILKRAENAIFARAISAIRPMENKKTKAVLDHDTFGPRKEGSPISSVVKKPENSKDSRVLSLQVTVNENTTRSLELKTDGPREALKSRKSPARVSIKNRLGSKIIETDPISRTPSRSPKRRLPSDFSSKVRRSSKERRARSRSASRRERYPSNDRRSHKQLSSYIRVEPRNDSNRDSRRKHDDKKRSHTPEDRRVTNKRSRSSRSRSRSQHNSRRRDQRVVEESHGKSREHLKSDEKSSKMDEQPQSDHEKSKLKITEPSAKKRSRDRDSSSSSTAASSTATSDDSQKVSKRHGKHRSKKKSRSESVESNIMPKRKKSKKEKKSKKKKKSRK